MEDLNSFVTKRMVSHPNSIFYVDLYKRYVTKDPSKAPAGANVQTGPKGGLYYETTEIDKPNKKEVTLSRKEALQARLKERKIKVAAAINKLVEESRNSFSPVSFNADSHDDVEFNTKLATALEYHGKPTMATQEEFDKITQDPDKITVKRGIGGKSLQGFIEGTNTIQRWGIYGTGCYTAECKFEDNPNGYNSGDLAQSYLAAKEWNETKGDKVYQKWSVNDLKARQLNEMVSESTHLPWLSNTLFYQSQGYISDESDFERRKDFLNTATVDFSPELLNKLGELSSRRKDDSATLAQALTDPRLIPSPSEDLLKLQWDISLNEKGKEEFKIVGTNEKDSYSIKDHQNYWDVMGRYVSSLSDEVPKLKRESTVTQKTADAAYDLYDSNRNEETKAKDGMLLSFKDGFKYSDEEAAQFVEDYAKTFDPVANEGIPYSERVQTIRDKYGDDVNILTAPRNTSDAHAIADSYRRMAAPNGAGIIMDMALDKSALVDENRYTSEKTKGGCLKVVNEVIKGMKLTPESREFLRANAESIAHDAGTLALMRGYDAFRVRGSITGANRADYITILNRSVVTLKEQEK